LTQTKSIATKEISDYITEVEFPRKQSTAICLIAFEELTEAINFIDLNTEGMTPEQQEIWERYKSQTVQFMDDMLLAEGNRNAIRRRLKLD
jgi:hypothetical protein